jgi:hypothetical protein
VYLPLYAAGLVGPALAAAAATAVGPAGPFVAAGGAVLVGTLLIAIRELATTASRIRTNG